MQLIQLRTPADPYSHSAAEGPGSTNKLKLPSNREGLQDLKAYVFSFEVFDVFGAASLAVESGWVKVPIMGGFPFAHLA